MALAVRRPDLPESLTSLVHRMLAKNPDERIQTCADVCSQLRQWLLENADRAWLRANPALLGGRGSAPSETRDAARTKSAPVLSTLATAPGSTPVPPTSAAAPGAPPPPPTARPAAARPVSSSTVASPPNAGSSSCRCSAVGPRALDRRSAIGSDCEAGADRPRPGDGAGHGGPLPRGGRVPRADLSRHPLDDERPRRSRLSQIVALARVEETPPRVRRRRRGRFRAVRKLPERPARTDANTGAFR